MSSTGCGGLISESRAERRAEELDILVTRQEPGRREWLIEKDGGAIAKGILLDEHRQIKRGSSRFESSE